MCVWVSICVCAWYGKDVTDSIRAFLAYWNVHDIRNRCCTWWGPSRDNNSASAHEYFRQLTAVLISKDTARLAVDPVNLSLHPGWGCNYYLNEWRENWSVLMRTVEKNETNKNIVHPELNVNRATTWSINLMHVKVNVFKFYLYIDFFFFFVNEK